jgi:RNA polymerase sigma factor (sigma-70 family)
MKNMVLKNNLVENELNFTDFVQKLIQKDDNSWRVFNKKFTPAVKAGMKPFNNINYQDKEDLINDVFLKTLDKDCKALKAFRGQSYAELGAYMKKISYNLSLRFSEKTEKWNTICKSVEYDEKALHKNSEEPSSVVIKNQTNKEIKNEIRNMPQIYRKVLLLYMNCYSHQMCANILNITLKTFQTRLFRAKNILRQNEKLSQIFTDGI